MTTKKKRHWSMTVSNSLTAYGLLVNQVCDNTLISSKEFVFRMLCLQLKKTEQELLNFFDGPSSKFLDLA